MPDDISQLFDRGLISPDALQRFNHAYPDGPSSMMTHQPIGPNPARPYVDTVQHAAGVAGDVLDHFSQPEYPDSPIGHFLNGSRLATDAGSLALGGPVKAAAVGKALFGGALAARRVPGATEAIANAVRLEEQGLGPQAIYDQTKAWRGGEAGDGWRFRVSDEGANIRGTPQTRIASDPVPLPEVLDHPEAYEAFPYLKSVVVQHQLGKPNAGIRLGPSLGPIPPTIYVDLQRDNKSLLSLLLHEAQHAVQKDEAFARGASISGQGNRGWWAKERNINDYYATPGEIEARMVQAEHDPKYMRRDWGYRGLANPEQVPSKTLADHQGAILNRLPWDIAQSSKVIFPAAAVTGVGGGYVLGKFLKQSDGKAD